ncbi:formate/nitrite transporter family protein [Mycoplasmatota bacterium WC44]
MKSPKEILEFTKDVGEVKINKSNMKTFIGSVLAGIFISLGAIGYFNVVPHIDSSMKGLAVFLGGVCFSIGLILVVVAGADLFTGNALTTLGMFDKRYKFKAVLKNWLIVLLGNIVGAMFMGFLVAKAHVITGVELEYLEKVVTSKITKDIPTLLASGILCNIIVALLVWMVYGCKTVTDKVMISVVGIIVFVVAGFEHVVANAFYFYAYLFNQSNLLDLTLQGGFLYNFVIVAIANCIGGGVVVAGLYHLYLKD